MKRLCLAIVLSTSACSALAAGGACRVSGTAYDAWGHPMRDAVVRLTDLQTRQASFSAADGSATFAFDGLAAADVGRYRLDVLSSPTVVTGSKIPTRSILGMTNSFACTSSQTKQDVRAQVF